MTAVLTAMNMPASLLAPVSGIIMAGATAASFAGAMEKGKNFMFRTAAVFVKEMGGITTKPLLTKEQKKASGN